MTKKRPSKKRSKPFNPLPSGHIIELAAKDAAKGFYIILNTGQSCALPNNTYVVDTDQLRILKKKGVKLTEMRKPGLKL